MRLEPACTVLLVAAALTGPLDAQEAPERQILQAVSPLPDSLRPGAGVLGFRAGQLVTLREGTNGMICLADTPGDERFHVACYHADLEPFMARGRTLREQGITDREQAAALYSLTAQASSVDPATGLPASPRGLYVVYLPFATEASTGISTTPSRERPWLMSPGEPWAHVMIAR
jgi:hypothetical protein